MNEKKENPFVTFPTSYRIILIALIIIYALAIFLIQLRDNTPHKELIFLSLIIFLSLSFIPIIFYKKEYGILHPLVFRSLFGIIGLIGSFTIYSIGLDFHPALPGLSENKLNLLVAYNLLLMSLGLITYYLAFFFFPSPKTIKFRKVKINNPAIKTFITLIFSLIIFLIYMYLKGGIVTQILSWQYGRHIALSGEGYWSFFIRFSLLASLIWITIDKKSTKKATWWIIFIASLTMIFLSTGSRSEIIYPLLFTILMITMRDKKIYTSKLILIILVSLIVLSSFGAFREGIWKEQINTESLIHVNIKEDIANSLKEISERENINSGIYPILSKTPKEVPLLYGKSYLSLITLPIPRVLWNEKPGLIGGQVGETFFKNDFGMPPTEIGELYWNFNIFGVIFGYILLGIFHKWITKTYLENKENNVLITIYVITLTYITPASNEIYKGLMLIVPIIILIKLMKSKNIQ